MTQQIALVTGANRGIGYEVAKQLGERDFRVLLGIRDVERGVKTEKSLRELGFAVEFIQLDLAKAASIDSACATLSNKLQCLDVLVNNAAVHYDDWQRVDHCDFDIVEEAVTVNSIGPWRLTNGLLPLIKASAHGRIVNVSSGAGALSSQRGGTPAYSLSKLFLNGLTMAYAARLQSSQILVNAVCPGWTATDMGGGGRPIPDGAKGVVWAATLDKDGPSGRFFRDGVEIPWV